MTGAVRGWTDERKALAHTMWLKGIPASRIAETLACGLSRNAIVGMIHRMGKAEREGKPPKAVVPPKPRPSRTTPRSTKRVAWSPAAIAVAPPPAPAIAELPPAPLGGGIGVGFFALRPRYCRRPLWGHLERPALTAMRFCGGSAPEGSSWCRECRPIVYSGVAA